MKRIVMLLLFALVIPSVGFAKEPLIPSIEELQKSIDELEIYIEGLDKDRNEAYRSLVNARPSPDELDKIRKKIGDITQKRENAAKEKARFNELLAARNAGRSDMKYDEDVKNREKKLGRFGLHTGFSLLGNINDTEIIGGLQVEFPLFRVRHKFDEKDKDFDSFPNNQIVDVSIEFSYTMLRDKWPLSEGISSIDTDADIHSFGISIISRQYINKSIWVDFLLGGSYNHFSIDKKDINTNVSKEFDNNALGYTIGAGTGYIFREHFFIGYLQWEIFAEFRYTFLKLEAVEISKAWGIQTTKEKDENHDFGVLKFGINLVF